MKNEVFKKVLDIIIPGSEILTYEVLPRNRLNENNEWVSDTPAIFLSITHLEYLSSTEFFELSETLSHITSHEVYIDTGLSHRRYNKTINFNNE